MILLFQAATFVVPGKKKVDAGMDQKPKIFGGMNIYEPSTEVSLGRAPRAPGLHVATHKRGWVLCCPWFWGLRWVKQS